MKKVVMLLILLLVLVTESYGAVSDDVYVRKDVYDANMQTMNTKLDMILEQLREVREEQKAQRADITELTRSLSVMSERVDRNFETLSERINDLDKRIDDLRNGIYLWLAAVGLIIATIT